MHSPFNTGNRRLQGAEAAAGHVCCAGMGHGRRLDVIRREPGSDVSSRRVFRRQNPEGLKTGRPPVRKFELIVNLKTAKGMGWTIPPEILATADDVIE